MELSKTAYVILGMLRLGRRTGYEIKSLVDVSTRFFWAASYGQIYPELKRLEEAGLVAGEPEAQGGRQRRAYTLTAAGDGALRDWIASGGPLHYELRHEGILRFFFADAATPAAQLELLRAMRAEHDRVRDELRRVRPEAELKSEASGNRFPLMTLDFGVAYNEFISGWCTEMEASLAEPATATAGA
jgi:DNA-binding PadR family transcriptional regulator